jgi:hypothetical protein
VIAAVAIHALAVVIVELQEPPVEFASALALFSEEAAATK